MSRVELNAPATVFQMLEFSGNMFSLNDFLGKNVLLVFNRGFL